MTLPLQATDVGHSRSSVPGAVVGAEGLGVQRHVLGPVLAVRDGSAIDLGAPRQRAVLALLLSRAGDTVPLSRIIEAFWGQDPPRYAVNVVQKHVGARGPSRPASASLPPPTRSPTTLRQAIDAINRIS